MRIQHNIMAMNAYRNYTNNTSALSKNLEKLSSGYKINRAGDDAAGLAISEKMRAQITGLDVAQKNAKDGISLVQTAEGALTEVHDMLNRMVELAGQSANGTYDNDVDRANLQKEVDQLLEEINRIADSSNFNGINLLDGTLGLNTEAFSLSKVDAAQSAVVSDAIQTEMAAAGADKGTNTILHKTGTEAVAGSFTVDLSQLSLKADGVNQAEIEITIGNETFTIQANDANTDLTAKDIAAKLVQANGGTSGKAGTILFGNADETGLEYVAKDNGDGTVTFTATNDGTGTALTNDVPSDKTSDDALAAINTEVTANKTTGDNTLTGAENIATTNITNSSKATVGAFGNAFLTLDMSKITDGMILEIAGEKYTFAVGADSKVDTAEANVIDLTKFDLATTDKAEQADIMAAITRATVNNKTFTVGNDGTYGKLTFAEKTDGAGKSQASTEMQEKMSTLEGFKSLVTVSSPDAANGTKITAAPGSIKEGDALTIGDKVYTFTTDATKTGDGYIQMGTNGADAMANLEAALNADGYTT
ncbi:MAG: hypothetical protein Q4G01_09385, partial [Eubacteriales bacterium]|nr:hypothetical protein [Eubacteriales bacterium]